MSNEYQDHAVDLAIWRGHQRAIELDIDLDDDEVVSKLIEEEYIKIIEEGE